MKTVYEEADIDDLYDHFYCQEDGNVTQSEMYEFLRGMTRAKPPGENYLLFKCCKCCLRCGCDMSGFVDWFKEQWNRCRKKPAETPMKVVTETKKKKKKEVPVQRDLLAMTSVATEPDAPQIRRVVVQ